MTEPINAPEAPETLPPAWQAAFKHSRFFRQLLGADPDVAHWLSEHADQPLDVDLLNDYLAATPASDEESVKRVLRKLRQRVLATLAVRDLNGCAPLSEVVETMTQLAEVTTNAALDFLHRQLVAQFGEPLDKQGHAQQLMILGMGKLGGRELNVSSDVDYIFIYPEDGKTAGGDGKRSIENFDFFSRLGKRLIAVIGEHTQDGQVFRVDMRLRPNGDSGALVSSIGALENYFITQGREWERYAWIKARVLNAGENRQEAWCAALKNVSRPFIFRKYLDFGAINAMRDLHAQIRREVTRKDRIDHIKLGPGGIREIEFIAQVFQLIRGGRDLVLQIQPTLHVLDLLLERRLLPENSGPELIDAYHFLRRLEHRLQYVNDAQTHSLPSSDDERQNIAESMGFADWAAFHSALAAQRERVARHFDAIFASPDDASGTHALTGVWLEQLDADDALEKVSELGFRHAKAMLERLQSFRQSSKYQQLASPIRERLDRLGPRLIEAAAATATPDATWQRGLDFFETISRRGAYLALLQQHPQALSKVAEMIGSSLWAAKYLTQHPILLDEVLDPRLYDIATDWAGFRRDLTRRLAEHAGDTEREMDILREAHHAQVFRLLAQDIAGLQSVEQLADHLTELADIIVETTLERCWEMLKNRHPAPERPPRFAVIAYGKLGGKELGYGSDLDLVCLYDDPEPNTGEIYARLVQRLSSWLSSQTSAGQLFAVDLRLRPNGDAGLLVSSLAGFREYQLDKAWDWEYQALTRARFCAGDARLGAQFEAVRREILCQKRDLTPLKKSVLEMRQRMLDAHASKGEEFFDIKHDPGGLVDVEFIVQYLILGHAHEHEKLCANLGNIALLGMSAELGLISPELTAPVRDIYRQYRRQQHAFRLDGYSGGRVERERFSDSIAAVKALWGSVFG